MERRLVRTEHRRELHLLEAERLHLRAELLRVRLAPVELQHLELLRLRERLSSPPQAMTLPPPPEPLRPEHLRPEPTAVLYNPLEEELTPPPPAEQQLLSLLDGRSTPQS
jgi:hypothetical protein